MRKILFILLLAPFALKSQTVNTFRDSTWFKRGVRFDSTLVFSKGAGVGKVWTSNANGTGSWQTFSSAGVTQGALDDSISAVRAIRKVDTIYKNLDSIVFKINGIRYSVLDSTGGGIIALQNDTLYLGSSGVYLPYIPLSGTVSGSPVTGDIAFTNSSNYGITSQDGSLYFKIFQDDNYNEISGRMIGLVDYTSTLPDLGYTQKIYVDSRISDTAAQIRSEMPDVSNFATITNLADTSSLLRGLINTKGTGTVTSVATDATLTGGTITTSGTLKVDTSVISTKANVTGLLLGKLNISDTANQNLGIRTDYINRLTTKQDNLISGTSIKTINSTSLLGSGNILTPDAQTLSAGTNTLTISGGNTVNLNRKVDTSYIGLNETRDSLIFNNTINGTAYRYAVRDSTGGGSGSALSSITAATSANTINNGDKTQEWTWNSISNQSGLKLSSTANGTNVNRVQKLFESVLTGAMLYSNNSSYAGYFDNQQIVGGAYGIYARGAVAGKFDGNVNITGTLNINSLGISNVSGVTYLTPTSNQDIVIGQAGSRVLFQLNGQAMGFVLSTKVSGTSYVYGLGCGFQSGAYLSEKTTAALIERNSDKLMFSSNSGLPGNYNTFTPTFQLTISGATNNIGIGTTSPDVSAKLDVSSTTQGFLPPRMTATQASAIASPAKSLMLYVTDTNGTFTSAGLWIYTTSWKLIIAE